MSSSRRWKMRLSRSDQVGFVQRANREAATGARAVTFRRRKAFSTASTTTLSRSPESSSERRRRA